MARFHTLWLMVLVSGLFPIVASGAEATAAPEEAQSMSDAAASETPQTQPARRMMRSRSFERDSMGSRLEGSKSWLGVQLSPVPAPLAAHLKIENKGVMVRNVFKGSPADKAGIDRYDVIVAVDDKDLDRGMSMLSRLICNVKPGDKVSLKIYQRGQMSAKEITLAEVPSRSAEMSLKYEDDSTIGRQHLYGMYGRDVTPWRERWTREDIEELPPMSRFQGDREDMRKYPERFERSVPPPSSFRQYQPEMREMEFDVRADGSITVHVEDGPTELNMTYPDEQTFKQKAPKLYEQYRETVERLK